MILGTFIVKESTATTLTGEEGAPFALLIGTWPNAKNQVLPAVSFFKIDPVKWIQDLLMVPGAIFRLIVEQATMYGPIVGDILRGSQVRRDNLTALLYFSRTVRRFT